MSAYVDDALGQTRLNLIVMTFFGGSALLLASVGIYGVFSYAGQPAHARDRHPHGARPGSRAACRNQVLPRGMRMSAISAAVGVAVAMLLSRSVASLLYGVKAADPLTFATMAAC
jgi:hypothetical protein